MMRRLVGSSVPIALLLVMTACDGAPGRPDRANAYVRPSEVMSFDVLYATNCSGCHGEHGTLGPALALANPDYLAWVPREAMRVAVARGVAGTGMPAFARSEGGWLTDAQIDAILDGAVAKWGHASPASTSEMPVYAQAGGDARRGGAAYREFCASCHGVDGNGTTKGSAIIQPDYLALVSDQALRTAIVVGRPDLGMPGWRDGGATTDVSNPMSAEQVTDIVAWLASFRPEL